MIDHLKAVWQFRYFWLSLVRLDIQNRYRRSVIGIGWSLLNPILMTVVFCSVFSSVLSTSLRDYAPFLVAGLTVWEFLKGSAVQGCDAFLRAEPYIRQCPLPFSIYPLRVVLGTFIHFAIALVVMVLAVPVCKHWGEPLSVYFPAVGTGVAQILQNTGPAILAATLLATMFAWGCATITAFTQVYFHDTKHLLEVAAQMFFFLTPLMYPRVKLDEQGLGWLADINPATVFLELIRTPLLTGVPPTADLFAQGGVLAGGCVGLACLVMAWLQKKVVFHM
jgi:lipopolysaccharide transport system permease protein